MAWSHINVFGAAEHNLKGIDVSIPRRSLTVVTGVSGSGKSSLAFDTIYAEGQRRYVESLSSYARQFLDQLPRPHVEHIEGLSPAISIEQKTTARNPRSTVGTVTEIYDYFRLLFAHVGQAHCPECGQVLQQVSADDIAAQVEALPPRTRVMILAPVVRGRKGEYRDVLEKALKDGYERVKIDGELRLVEPGMKLARHFSHHVGLVIDRVVAGSVERPRLVEAIRTALSKADGFVTVDILPGADGAHPKGVPWTGERVFTESVGCPTHGPQNVELIPRMFSFNSNFGACPTCEGLGVRVTVDEDRLIPDTSLSIEQGAIAPWASYFKVRLSKKQGGGELPQTTRIRETLERLRVPADVPWRKLTAAQRERLMHGDEAAEWEGMVNRVKRLIEEYTDEENESFYIQYLREIPCTSCMGARLRPEALAVKLADLSIADVASLQLRDLLPYATSIKLTPRQQEIARQPLKEIIDRTGFLLEVGLGYLSLNRTMGTLSGGESQRVRLATQIGSRLTGVLYILDEPSIGLHQRDNDRLIQSLVSLRDLGNTVLVVEHDEATIRRSDHVIDLGPGAGEHGGSVVSAGTPAHLEADPASLTGRFLSGAEVIAVPTTRRAPTRDALVLADCRHNNLRSISARFPLGLMVGVSGVSGSGKSSLVIDTLLPALMSHCYGSKERPGAHGRIDGLALVDKVIHVDQAPIGRTPRSNPATYTKAFDLIRTLFASTEEARLRGYGPGRFSFNVEGGRCAECEGQGMRKIAMHFLPDVYVECESCGGRRYNPETLEVHYRGTTIADTLEMTIEHACAHFDGAPQVSRLISTLNSVGLGYLRLGQPATTLSGGEAQRIKLARELGKRNTGRTVYILDEPTTGLHFEDVRKLISVLSRLVAAGSTVIVIEHNLDVLKCCDWLIDLGPEGGDGGGSIVAEGTPEHVAASGESLTGRFLAPMLRAGR